jgi:Spy/CpxP family protein refolding chaperone
MTSKNNPKFNNVLSHHLEFPTMQLSSLSKVFTTVGLMATLSVATIATIAQAQSSAADSLAQSKVCDRVFKQYGETDGNQTYFDDYKGLNLTDRQKKADQAFSKQGDAKREVIMRNIVSVPESLGFSPTPGVSIPPDIQAAIDKVNNTMPKVNQEAALNRRFGKYGRFIVTQYVNYYGSPQDQAKMDQITKDYYTQMQNLMTPAQRPQYQKNLASRLKINAACDAKWPLFGSALGRISDKAPGTK